LNVLSTLLAVAFLMCGAIVHFRRRRAGHEIRDWVPYGKMGRAWSSLQSSATIEAIRKSL
ncbi:MAG: hypothetical protein AAFY42_02855, partial [Pseudomonadota bacterium]